MTSIIRRTLALAALVVVATAMTGCSESSRQQASGKGNIRAVNAIVTAPAIDFLIEERFLASVDFKQATSFNVYDNLSYNFNFDLQLPGETDLTRIATQFIDVQADHEYTVVLSGTVAIPSTSFWEDPIREWEEGDTVFEVFFAHLAASVGTVDVYFAPEGTMPVVGLAVATLSAGERAPQLELEQGSYEIIVTPPNDPATIIFQSAPLSAIAQSRVTIAIFDPDPTLPGNIAVNSIGQSGASTRIADVNFPSQARTLHAAFGTANYDGYLDGNFANLVFSDIAFLELSPYADVATGVSQLTLTPVGNIGTTIHEADISVAAAFRRTVVLAGQPGELSFLSLADNARPIELYPQLRILNASFNTDVLDVYILDPGTPIDDAVLPRILGIPTLTPTNFIDIVEGMRELTVTLRGETTPIAAPVVIDLANGDSIDMIIVDTVDPAVVELVPFDTQLAP